MWVGVGGWDIQRDSLREGERNSVSQKTMAYSAEAQTTNSLTAFPNSQHPTALPHCPTKQPKFQQRLSPTTFQNSPQPTALPNSPKKQPKFQQRPAHRPSRTVNNQQPSPTAQRNKPKASTANSPTDISTKAKAQPTTANRLPQQPQHHLTRPCMDSRRGHPPYRLPGASGSPSTALAPLSERRGAPLYPCDFSCISHPDGGREGGREGGGGGGGGGGVPIAACLSHVTVEHASLSRRSTVHIPNRDASNIGKISKFVPSYIFFVSISPSSLAEGREGG